MSCPRRLTMSKDYRPLAFCYIIKNKVNGKRYVGQTTQTLKSRFASFPYSHNKYIVEDCEKYGKESFIVDIMPCYLDALDNMEKDLIETFDTTNPEKGYNVQSGGSNTNPTEDSYLFLSDEELQSRLDKIKDTTSNQKKRVKVRIKRGYEIKKIMDKLKESLVSNDCDKITLSKEQDNYLYKELLKYYWYIDYYTDRYMKKYCFDNAKNNFIDTNLFPNGELNKANLMMLIKRFETMAVNKAPKPILFPNYNEIDSKVNLEIKLKKYSEFLCSHYYFEEYNKLKYEKERRDFIKKEIVYVLEDRRNPININKLLTEK